MGAGFMRFAISDVYPYPNLWLANQNSVVIMTTINITFGLNVHVYVYEAFFNQRFLTDPFAVV